MTRRICLVIALMSAACAARTHVTPADSGPSPSARLAAADAQVKAGCFDCLLSAFNEYTSLRSIPAVADAASIGAARSAVLLAIRERELGAEDSGYLLRAREIAGRNPRVQQALGLLLDVDDTLPTRGSARQVSDDVELQRNQIAVRNRAAWTEQLRAQADADALYAYSWLAFNCAYVSNVEHAVDQWLAVLPTWRDTPLIALKAATCGSRMDTGSLQRIVENDARFVEVHYFLGLALSFTGKIDEAMDHLLKAYAWRNRWPSVTNSLGVDYIALEEFDRAIEFFDRTLAVLPRYPEALLNKAKALTYAGRYVESIDVVDQLLTLERWLVGDARYWRALNEADLDRNDEAWVDVELAAKLLFDAEVPKLAGMIAYRRKQLDVSRDRFELSQRRNPNDCETGFYLGIVLSEQGTWTRVTEVLTATAACLEDAEIKLTEEIAAIRASSQPQERKDRQIAKREQQIATNRRRIVTSWFNTAVGYFNLSRTDEARRFAEKVADDEQFGERARDLLARIR